MKGRLVYRLLAPLLATSVMLLAIGGLAAWFLHGLQRNTSETLDRHVNVVKAVERFELSTREVRYNLCQYLVDADLKHLRNAYENYRDGGDWLTVVEKLADSPEDRQQVKSLHNEFDQFGKKLLALSQPEADPDESLREKIHRLLQKDFAAELRLHGDQLLDSAEARMTESSSRNRKIADRMAMVLFLLGSCGAVAGLLTGFGLARGIRRSVTQLSVRVHDAAGKLNEVVGPVAVRPGEHFEDLDQALHRLSRQVGDVVDRLQQSQRAVLRAEQLAAVGQLAAGLAHEIRNPLMSMRILVQTALEDETGTGLDETGMRILEEEISRLNQLLQSFLDFARPPKTEKQTVDLVPVIRQQLELISPRAEQQNVKVTYFGLDGKLPAHVDTGQIRQLTANLMINALEAMPGGGTLHLALSGQLGEYYQLTITDSGCGLPDHLQKTIFDPFVSTKETGTGLGLAICKRIVDAHGGTIDAHNLAEGGAEFIIRIPNTAKESK